MESTYDMPEKEWKDIQNMLLNYHSIFYETCKMGKPFFSETVDRAAVGFNEEGEFIEFHFNKKFWDSLDTYNKLFVICHESLHVFYNHGLRFSSLKTPEEKINSNYAMDVVINHNLCNEFGFIKEKIKDWKNYCWVETVFKESPKHNNLPISEDETAEFYYQLLQNKNKNKQEKSKSGSESGSGSPQNSKEKNPSQESEGAGSGKDTIVPKNVKTVDSHSFMTGQGKNKNKGQDFSKISKKIFEKMNEESLEAIKNLCGKNCHKNQNPFSPAGTEAGGLKERVSFSNVKVKKPWESIVRKWVKKKLTEKYDDAEQWFRRSRRFSMLGDKLFLPASMEIETIGTDENKIEVYFYMDTSGSCIHLKDRFFNLARSIPKKKFEIKMFCFDTKVYNLDINVNKVYGGGGTSFNIIENHIQTIKKQENKKYPDAVWVMTDGLGDKVNPEKPKNWFWLIDTNKDRNSEQIIKEISRNYLPEESQKFSLHDFI